MARALARASHPLPAVGCGRVAVGRGSGRCCRPAPWPRAGRPAGGRGSGRREGKGWEGKEREREGRRRGAGGGAWHSLAGACDAVVGWLGKFYNRTLQAQTEMLPHQRQNPHPEVLGSASDLGPLQLTPPLFPWIPRIDQCPLPLSHLCACPPSIRLPPSLPLSLCPSLPPSPHVPPRSLTPGNTYWRPSSGAMTSATYDSSRPAASPVAGAEASCFVVCCCVVVGAGCCIWVWVWC